MHQRYQQVLNELKSNANLRQLPAPVAEGLIDLSSNDYLGINKDQQLKAEFLASGLVEKLDLSASSSRLLTGNSAEYEQLENTISRAYQRKSCLVFNSGYHANIGILPALTGKKDLILADKLVHASIIDGTGLSKAEVRRYNHMNYGHLETLLQRHRNNYDQVFIVTESIFSMDGDVVDLDTLIALKKRYNAFLYVDEAHAVGVRGENGLGLAEEEGQIKKIDFIVGTFGKALASIGAFVVCDTVFKNYLVNTSRSLIFTTALPPVNLAWTNFIFSKLPHFKKRRENLHRLSETIYGALQIPPQSHIIPFILGSNEAAVNCANDLMDLGFYVMPIRHPTVPEGTARLRLSLNALLKEEQLGKLVNYLKKYDRDHGHSEIKKF